jgi:hypothetical protein
MSAITVRLITGAVLVSMTFQVVVHVGPRAQSATPPVCILL